MPAPLKALPDLAEVPGMKTWNTILVALCMSAIAHAEPADWQGNHPDAAAEAWTWMGHLRELDPINSRMTERGLGFIFYYTRSTEKALGNMNFRSSAVTSTVRDVGVSFKTNTVYLAQERGGELLARKGDKVDLTFRAGAIEDRVVAQPMTVTDFQKLNDTLKYYPGLKVAPGFQPRKTRFQFTEKDGTRFDLTFYSIWPVLSAPGGRMRFLGQDGTYSFSEPMMVTVGTADGKPVVGLSFLDRQWAKDFFGINILSDLGGLLKYANALKYAHSWSAFHARNERTGEYSFFHLWHQWLRTPGQRDQLTDYSGMLYMRGGVESGMVDAGDYDWAASGFVHNTGREVMMDYSEGRYGFFPSRTDLSSKKFGLKATLYASPALQNLNQPIPFFEGYASGEAVWRGDRMKLQGRLESSRLMFRAQDYDEMMDVLAPLKDGWEQPDLQAFILEQRRSNVDDSPLGWLHRKMSVLAGLLGELDLKLAIFGGIMSGEKNQAVPGDPDLMRYF